MFEKRNPYSRLEISFSEYWKEIYREWNSEKITAVKAMELNQQSVKGEL